MAAPPPYTASKGKYPPPPPSSESPCWTCLSNPTHQRCSGCCNRPNTNTRWPPPTGPIIPGNVGFRPSAPLPPNVPEYHHTSFPNPRPPRYQPASCPTCRSCSCTGHGPHFRPRPVAPPRTSPWLPSGGGVKSYYWVDTHSHGGVPSTALQGGHDVDGAQIFVGRAFHEGDWLPAKVIPERNIAYVAFNGLEHPKHQYQILCEQRFDWVPSSGGHVPQGAVEGGRTSDGETLYVGRVHHEGSLTVGKVHPSHGVCYIPFGGREIGNDSYEILVLRS